MPCGRRDWQLGIFLANILPAAYIWSLVGHGSRDAILTPSQAEQTLAMHGVASEWPSRSLGSHRVRLELDGDGSGDMAWARVEWRLPGLPMQGRRMVLVDERTGSMVRSLYVVSASTEAAEILFEFAGSSSRGQPSRRREPPAREGLRREENYDDTSYTYEEEEPTSWKPRTEPGCGCTGYKNGHGFGAYCKAWEEALDPSQTPWCYVSKSCAASGVHSGSFGERFIDCVPVRSGKAPAPGGGAPRRSRGRRELMLDMEEEEEEEDGDGSEGGDEEEDEDSYDYSYDEEAPTSWKPRGETGCACTGHSNSHGFGAYCKAWEARLEPGQTPWCYVAQGCAAADKRRGSFGTWHVDCAPVYAARDDKVKGGSEGQGGRGRRGKAHGGGRKGQDWGQEEVRIGEDGFVARRLEDGVDEVEEMAEVEAEDEVEAMAEVEEMAEVEDEVDVDVDVDVDAEAEDEEEALDEEKEADVNGRRVAAVVDGGGRATYLLYYLPFDDRPCVTGPATSCTSHYDECASGGSCGGGGGAARQFQRRAERLVGVTVGDGGDGGDGGGKARAPKAGWRESAAAKGTLRVARAVAFEARTQRDSFAPMEVAASAAEAAGVRARCAALRRAMVVWAEDRTRPIRMLDRLPLRLLAAGMPMGGNGGGNGNGNGGGGGGGGGEGGGGGGAAAWLPNSASHVGVARRGEFYAFQIGVFAPERELRLLPRWGALTLEGSSSSSSTTGGATGATTTAAGGGAVGTTATTLAAWRLRCINVPNGSAQATGGLRLGAGGVQPLWFGLDVPADAAPGTYRGAVTVRELGGGGEERVGLAISVDGDAPPLPEHGDAELWRQSRLRWLDSTAGDGAVDMATVAAEGGAAAAAVRSGWGPHRSRADVWQRVQLDEATLTMTASGRRAVRLSRRGLPASIAVGGVELLHEPMQLRLVRPSGAELRWQPHPDEPGSAPVVFSRDAAGGVEWRARGVVSSGADARGGSGTPVPAGCRGLSVAVHGVLHTDGLAQLHVSLQASPSAHHLTPLSSSPSSSHAAPPPECELADVQLLAPLVERETRLINGFGVKGAARPDEVLFRWKERQVGWGQAGLNCRVWLGGAAAGVQLNLQGLEQSQSASSSHCGTVKVAVLARPWLASTVLSACI